MRINLLAAVLAAGVSVVACKSDGSSGMVGNDRVVNIDLECLANDSVRFTLSPWRVTIPAHGAIVWKFGKAPNGTRAVIAPPANTTRWPFQQSSFTTVLGNPNPPGTLNANAAPGTYKYTVTTSCDRGSGKIETIIIDPDMMIPPPLVGDSAVGDTAG
jgi:hypothetical protein